MNIKRLYEFLIHSENKQILAEIEACDLKNINIIQALKSKYPHQPISELLTLIRLRSNASKRILSAEKYLFTSKGVEQSSSSAVAQYHAKIFSKCETVADLCCGNGIDLLNIAQGKKKVYAIDLSNSALYCSRYNSYVSNLHNIEFVNQRAEEFSREVDGVFIDPDRRPDERRVIQGNDISPNFSSIIELIKNFKNIVVKLSPVFDYEDEKLEFEHTWEFVSEDGVLKEILLCTGIFATSNCNKKAVILPENIFLENNNEVNVTQINEYIYDPDPSLIRSRLIQDYAYSVSANLINRHLSILTSDNLIKSSFLKAFKVLSIFHYNKKTLQTFIKQNSIGKLVVKVRGFPDRPNQILQKIKLKGPNDALIYLIRMDNEFLCLVLQRT